MKWFNFIFLSLLVANTGYGDDVQLKYISINTPAYFSGFLISEDYEKKFRLLDSELRYEQNLNLSLAKINKAYEDNTNIMQERIDKQQKYIDQLQDKAASSNTGFYINTGYFVLGCALTTALAFAIYRTTK